MIRTAPRSWAPTKYMIMYFNPGIVKYNGECGHIQAVVNMCPILRLQRKGRVPHHKKGRMQELHATCDKMESLWVLAKPESISVTLFWVQKPSDLTCLVTSFAEVDQYSKPQPLMMHSVNQLLQNIHGRTSHSLILFRHFTKSECGIWCREC